ncbi:hypothetical protein [Nonomuraea sp. NPDC050202]|uniref:effector-associated domain EAD1-containing protein n=1 Tax=Nonomuraea sp. NPDC050202 TaxID=3155035 RepID=UPI0033EC808A
MLDTPPLPWSYQPIRDLHRCLAAAYENGQRTRALVDSVAGFPSRQGRIDWDHSYGEELWRQIMNAAADARRLRSLVDAVLADPSVAGHHGRIRSALRAIETDTPADVPPTSDELATVIRLPVAQRALDEAIDAARRTRDALSAGDSVTFHPALRSLNSSLERTPEIARLLTAPQVNTLTRVKEQTSDLLTAVRTADAIDEPEAERAQARRSIPSLKENLHSTLQKLLAEADAVAPHER